MTRENLDDTTTLFDKIRVGQKTFRLAMVSVAIGLHDVFNPVHIEEGESLSAYIARRDKARAEADEAKLKDYILDKEIGSVAIRDCIEFGFGTKEFFRGG